MGNMLTDDRFPKDRVFISGSYNNEYARVVARAISLNRVIFVRHKHLYQKFVTIKEENIQYPVEVRPEILEFEFIPFALSYNSCWYMFGMRPGRASSLYIHCRTRPKSACWTLPWIRRRISVLTRSRPTSGIVSPSAMTITTVTTGSSTFCPATSLCTRYSDVKLIQRNMMM